MRTHHRFSWLWPAYDIAFARDLVRPEYLAAGRFEPVYSFRFEGFLDLAFEREGEWLSIPMLCSDGLSLMLADNPPIVWPDRYRSLEGEATREIERRVFAWLRSIVLGRLVNDEALKYFRTDRSIRTDFERARALGWLGAAPYAEVVRSVAPGAYAQRLAMGRSAALEGDDAPNAAAALSAAAARTALRTGDDERDAFACRWFRGLAIETIDASRSYDVRVGARVSSVDARQYVATDEPIAGERAVDLAEPLPIDVMLSFDVQDGPAARRFGVQESVVEVRRPPIGEPKAAGQSGGQIALVLRDDVERFPDADLDAAVALRARLRAEGFRAEISSASKVDVRNCDIVHVFDLRHGASLVALLRDAEVADVPVVVTPFADDRRNEAGKGTSGALLIPRVTYDTVSFEEYGAAFAQRRVSGLTELPWYNEAAGALLARARAAVVASNGEAEFLRSRFAFAGVCVTVPATLPNLAEPTDRIGSLVGPEEYVLVHRAIEPGCNQVFLVAAARRLGLPVVLLGEVADVEYFRFTNETCGPLVMALRESQLTAAEIAGIYGRARVFADVGWYSRGLHRFARAGSLGTGLVGSTLGYAAEVFGGRVDLADPADIEGMAGALQAAWNRPVADRAALVSETLAACDPFAGLVTTLQAYQQAAAPVRS